ncbi:MAG: hypothetical protein BWY78_01295 [Alphaproteobacteria bacterium ADurb.Bin438]|nr:MAG: hypothetical protein BWY78_01295 [Alphaproteobacteria bacterium ADurb.Bin438]
MTSFFMILVFSFLFFLFLKVELLPFVYDNKIIPEIMGVMGNILTFAIILSAITLLNKPASIALPCFVLAYCFNLIFVNYFGIGIFGTILSLPILGGSLYYAFKDTKKAYLYGCLFFFILNTLTIMSINNNIQPQIFVNEKKPKNEDEVRKNVIIIALSNHIGYEFGLEKSASLDDYRKAHQEEIALNGNKENLDKDTWKKTYEKVIGGFYISNGFNLYTHAFNYEGSSNDLIASSLNLNINYDKNNDFLIHDESVNVYNSSPERLALKENYMFKSFKENGYNINVYQSKGVNLCSDNVLDNVDECYTYTSSGEVYKADIKLNMKSRILTDMWISSYFKSFSINKIFKNFLFIKDPTKYPVVINEQFSVLDKLKKDIIKAKGKNLFFAYVRLPYAPYVYNANCSINDITEWKDNVFNDYGNEYIKYDYYQKYFNQLFCSYGHLNNFMEELKRQKILEHSLIFIYGDGGSNLMNMNNDYKDKYSKAINELDNMKNRYSTTVAYYDPFSKAFTAYNGGCDVSTILKRNLLKDKNTSCKPVSLKSGDEALEMANNLYKSYESEVHVSFDAVTLIREFRMWAELWRENQGKK